MSRGGVLPGPSFAPRRLEGVTRSPGRTAYDICVSRECGVSAKILVFRQRSMTSKAERGATACHPVATVIWDYIFFFLFWQTNFLLFIWLRAIATPIVDKKRSRKEKLIFYFSFWTNKRLTGDDNLHGNKKKVRQKICCRSTIFGYH